MGMPLDVVQPLLTMRHRFFGVATVIVSMLASFNTAWGDAGQELSALTGAHVRVVWVQDQSASNSDTLALGRELQLMGLDNQDGKGERVILSEIQNYSKPLLTPDGQRIVFSERYGKEIFVVNWDGTGKRRLGSGYAVEVWAEPKSKDAWVYGCVQVGKVDSINFKSLRRIRLDGGTRWEPVWDKTEISPDNFQLSGDGTFAAGEFPWPHAGTADLATKTWRKRADGCWASLAPDNSGLCWIFDGPHRNVYFYPRQAGSSWKVSLNTVPDFGKYEVFHPRWSNHVRYLAITGPYKVKTNVNYIAGGGPEVEVYVSRFSEDFRRVEACARVTHNSHGDFYPDVWIDGGETSTIPADVFQQNELEIPAADLWPGTSKGLVFLWDNAAAPNVIASPNDGSTLSCRVEPHGKARFNRFFDMDCQSGSFTAELAGRDLYHACHKTNELTIEAAITTSRADQSGPARIMEFGSKSGTANFMLGQDRDTLVFELNTRRPNSGPVTARLGSLDADQLLHLVLTYIDSQLKCYINGKPVEVTSKIAGDFSNWTEQELVFGADYAGKRNWQGRLEGIAIFDRALTAEEAQRQFELFSGRLDLRAALDRVRVRATCLEMSQIPDPRTIVPYRRALVIHRFRIDKLLQGTLENREILVAQWGILDKVALKEAKLRVGQTVELTLEAFEEHPELKSERQIVDVEGLDLPWYYSVGK